MVDIPYQGKAIHHAHMSNNRGPSEASIPKLGMVTCCLQDDTPCRR